MRFRRINRTLALAFAIGVVTAPAAAAQSQDLRSPDTRDAAERSQWVPPRQDLRSPDARDAAGPPRWVPPRQDLRSPDTRDTAVPPRNTQDLRSPDTRDAAEGRGLDNAPVVEFVEVPEATGFDWSDAVLGAAAGIGLVLIATAGVIATVRTRRRIVAGS
jgi:hypothetical protein